MDLIWDKKITAASPSDDSNEMIESSSLSSTTDKSNSDNQQVSKKKLEHQSKPHEINDEEWLNQYMFGKKKGKLDPLCFMDSLEHHRKSYDYIEESGVVHPKRLTYKNKSSSFESNEICYRIYVLTLKRISHYLDDAQFLANLLVFLQQVVEFKFVQAHNDFNLEEVSAFLETTVFSKSTLIIHSSNRDTISKCICICVAGLNQILRRFSQHYRSLYRLAHFYSKFLDLRVNN